MQACEAWHLCHTAQAFRVVLQPLNFDCPPTSPDRSTFIHPREGSHLPCDVAALACFSSDACMKIPSCSFEELAVQYQYIMVHRTVKRSPSHSGHRDWSASCDLILQNQARCRLGDCELSFGSWQRVIRSAVRRGLQQLQVVQWHLDRIASWCIKQLRTVAKPTIHVQCCMFCAVFQPCCPCNCSRAANHWYK